MTSHALPLRARAGERVLVQPVLDGLFLATMFQVYPHDRGQNYSIELAERLVRHLDER